MLHTIVIRKIRVTCVVRRVDVYALHLAFIFGQECLQGKEVVAMNEHVFGVGVARAVGKFRLFLQDTWLDICDIVLGVVFPYPRELKFLFVHGLEVIHNLIAIS